MQPGDIIGGRFAILWGVAEGTMGCVYRARSRDDGRAAAVKVMRPGEDAARFLREARMLAEIQHPGIVRYLDHGQTADGEMYLAMDWIEGETLARRLARGPLGVGEALALGWRLAEALGHAHARGVVHRDVKPGNVLLAGGAVERPVLIDFGVAKHEDGTSTQRGALMGSPAYMSPEQVRGEARITPASDAFAFGCVLFRSLVGRAPFDADDVMAVFANILLQEPPLLGTLCEGIPPELEALVAATLAKDPEARPPHGAALAAALAAILSLHERGSASAMGRAGARPSPAAPRLMAGERRMMSLVVASRALPDTDDTLPAQRPRRAAQGAPPTLPPPASQGDLARLRAAAAPFGASVETLADGSILAPLVARDAATDQAARAAFCALALRALLPGASMAIATGRGEVAGTVPVGEIVGRAAALLRASREDLAGRPASGGAAPIRIDEITAGLLDGRFDVRGAPAGGSPSGLALHGEGDRGHEVFEDARTLLGAPVPCVGRERELTALLAIFEDCVRTPEAHAVVVRAEPGIGKSRLVHELVHAIRARVEPLEVWFGRGGSTHAQVPFGLIGPALRRTAGVLSGEPQDVQRRKLRARAARHVGAVDRERVAEFLGEIAGVHFADDDSVQLRAARSDRQLMADQVRRAWEDFVEAECATQPVVLVLEDLHWGDRPSVQLVDAALSRVERRPFLVLALARPEIDKVFPRLFGGRVGLSMDLRPLGRAAAERLTRLALGDAVDLGLLRRIIDLSGGNAFFLEGLIRAAARGQGEALPETIIAMVEGRFEGIDPAARRVLRAASVFGEIFREGGVEALLACNRESVRAHLADLERLEVVTPRGRVGHDDDREHAFQHTLLREAAYATLTDGDRVMGHLLAGRWLLREGEPSAAIVADHFARGEDPASAAEHYRRAAEHALAADDLQAAIDLSERGMACGAAGELAGALRLLQAEARSWRGELDEAERAVAEAVPWLPRGRALHYRGIEVLAVVYGVQSKRAELAALARALLDEGDPAADPRAYAAALARVAAHLVSTGPSPHTARLLAELDASAIALGEEDAAFSARAHHVRAVQAAHSGDPGEYLRYAERAVQCFERIGDLRNACVHRMNVGDACRELGVYPRAQASLAEALEVAERMKLHTFVAAAKLNLGQVLACRGAFEPAGRLVREAADQASALGYRRMLGAANVYLARILLSAGDPAAAATAAEAAALATSALPSLLPLAHEVLARIRLAEGDPRGALILAREAVEGMTAAGFVEEGEARIRLTFAEALHAGGRLAEAREALGVARARLLVAAERIRDRELSRSFLEEVHESARTLELWRAWAGRDATSRPPSRC